MDTSTTRPNIESTAIPYSNNQPADSNLWGSSFFSHFYIWDQQIFGQRYQKYYMLTSKNQDIYQTIFCQV